VNHPLPKPIQFRTLKKQGEILEQFRGTRPTKEVMDSLRERPAIVTTELQEEKAVTVDPRVERSSAPAAVHPPRFVSL